MLARGPRHPPSLTRALSLAGAVSDVEMQEHYDEFFEVSRGLVWVSLSPPAGSALSLPPASPRRRYSQRWRRSMARWRR